MRRTRGQTIEIVDLSDFDDRLGSGVDSLYGWRLHDLDLRGRTQQLEACSVAGSLFLGCRFAPGVEELIRAHGGIVFPQIPSAPIDTYRTRLYDARELYGTGRYHQSLDARVYAWSRGARGREVTLAAALHDHAIDVALADYVRGRDLIGVMGGHALRRGDRGYAAAARLGHGLGASFTVATGGGPGAMEAANLGARMASYPTSAVEQAVATLSAVPSFAPDIAAWAAGAFGVISTHPETTETLGIPTWHYGHEPPNPFATSIAKYFGNATREAVLLEVCNAGIVFLPGAGGTVQEIFTDACENYYADESSVAPMILVDVEHWTRTLPAWPLLRALARGRAMEPHIHLVDTVEEALALLGR